MNVQNGHNFHWGNTVLGYCEQLEGESGSIQPGKYLVQIYESASRLSSSHHGNPYLGWSETQVNIDVMEVPKLDTTTSQRGQFAFTSHPYSEDDTKNGVVPNRQLTFKKKKEATWLRVMWYDNIGCENGGVDTCEWYILIDGHHCESPGRLTYHYYKSTYSNMHLPRTYFGYCKRINGGNIGVGTHTLTISESTVSGDGNPHLGWGSTRVVMEVLEVDVESINSPYSVHQSMTNDGCENCIIGARSHSFTKQNSGTSLRITWHDNFRCIGGGKRCQWELLFNGQSCSDPGYIAYQTSHHHYGDGNGNYHVSATLSAYCLGLPQGTSNYRKRKCCAR
jgi:hypothetical protein